MTQIVDLGKLRFYWAGTYNPATEYELNDVVRYGSNNYVYINVAKTTGTVPTNTTYWSQMLEGMEYRGDWATSTQYYVNDVISHGGNAYICLIQNTSGVFETDLTAGKWDLLAGGVRWRGEWAPTTSYLYDDVVRYLGSSYIATEDFTSGTNFTTEFSAGKWVFFAQGGDDVLPPLLPNLEGYSLTVDATGTGIAWVNATGSQNVFYVAPDGNNSNPGDSLTLPFANIQAAVAAIPAGQPGTIFVKTGTYQEALLPIVVPPNVAIVGDSLRTVIVQPAAGNAADGVTPNNEATMFLLSNGSILNKMTFSGMTGWVPGSPAEDVTTSTAKGIFLALNPASPVTTKSPYVIECSAIGTGCIGALVDGDVQASGYKSMLFHGYTVIADNGIGFWVRDGGRSELVSCFTYYAYFGYAASGGGTMRSLNGNNSYGTWGAASFGYLASEVPHTGTLYGEQLTVTTDPITQGFSAGSTITGLTTGATGTVTNLQSSAGKIYYKKTSVVSFQNDEIITDGTYQLQIAPQGVAQQQGFLLVGNGFNDAPAPGASIQIAGDPSAYVIQSVSGTYVNTSSILSIALVQEKATGSPDGAALTIRYNYSQIRLTGHDFLNIGTGGITTTNYPGVPLQPPVQGNEVDEDLPGRVYYVTTDQDGNFRVGDYFRIDQGTGRATLNANAFDLSGLTSLRLGSIGAQLGETINEFSADPTLGGNSNQAVPTEYAVKTYVDTEIANINLSEIVGGNTIFARTGTAATFSYSVFSNSLILPATWTLSGTVPTGVSINSSTGVLTAASTVSTGTYTFSIVATGSAGSGVLSESVSLTVNPAYPIFSSTTLPVAVTPSSAFSSTATQATATTGTVVHTITAGSLPAWLTLASNGVLSGTAPASPANTFIGPYNFTVTATNGVYSNSAAFSWYPYLGQIQGQSAYTTPGTYTWIAPTAVTSVSVVCVGGGGAGQDNWANPCGSGGGLGWKNSIPVVPGTGYTVVVGAGGTSTTTSASPTLLGGNSYFISLATVSGYGGGNVSGIASNGPNANSTYGGGYVGDGGGAGGYASSYQGGGGAGGYTGRGGNGYEPWNSPTVNGGYGGGYYSSTYGTGAGGGVGILGATGYPSSGNAFYNPFSGYNNSPSTGSGGQGAHGGTNGQFGENPFSSSGGVSSNNIQGGNYGGGGGGPGTSYPNASGNGGGGAVRIIWGTNRLYPNTNTADVTPSGPV